jgi:hypothetical protein
LLEAAEAEEEELNILIAASQTQLEVLSEKILQQRGNQCISEELQQDNVSISDEIPAKRPRYLDGLDDTSSLLTPKITLPALGEAVPGSPQKSDDLKDLNHSSTIEDACEEPKSPDSPRAFESAIVDPIHANITSPRLPPQRSDTEEGWVSTKKAAVHPAPPIPRREGAEPADPMQEQQEMVKDMQPQQEEVEEEGRHKQHHKEEEEEEEDYDRLRAAYEEKVREMAALQKRLEAARKMQRGSSHSTASTTVKPSHSHHPSARITKQAVPVRSHEPPPPQNSPPPPPLPLPRPAVAVRDEEIGISSEKESDGDSFAKRPQRKKLKRKFARGSPLPSSSADARAKLFDLVAQREAVSTSYSRAKIGGEKKIASVRTAPLSFSLPPPPPPPVAKSSSAAPQPALEV